MPARFSELLSDEARRARLADGALRLRHRFAVEYSLEAAQQTWRLALFAGEAD